MTVQPETNHPQTRSKKKKRLIGIRHGVSLANEWMRQPGNRWGDSTFRDDESLRDSPLSPVGIQQAQSILHKSDLLDRHSRCPIELIVTSPLTRCVQTLEYSGIRTAMEHVKVLALPLLTERVYTASDTGRSVEELEKDFPRIDWQQHFNSSSGWWFQPKEGEVYPEWRPSGEGQFYAVQGEPQIIFEERMNELRRWLLAREEETILLVSHWGVLRHFTGEEIDNCGVVCFNLEQDGSVP